MSSFMMSDPEAVVTLNEVYADIKDHFNGHRVSTELSVIEILRRTHPEFHITCTANSFDLFGYAKAGHAQAALDCDETTLNSQRIYHGPPTRKSTQPARLQNHVRFGRWRYHWEDNAYLLYEVEYQDLVRGRSVKLYFILSPRPEFSTHEGEDSVIDQLLLAVGAWSAQLHDEVYVFDDGYWQKNSKLWESVQDASWEEVILDPTMKENLIQDVQGFFDNKELYKRFSVPWKRGVILHGLPGNGKTISIKALINTLNNRSEPVPSLYVKSFEACSGEKSSIDEIFKHARKMAPCLLIFEDIDSLVTDETRSYFLNEVDGLESNDGILMIGSTNHLDKLDPAISKRPSRFDRKYRFNLPAEAERAAYCRFWAKKFVGNDQFEFSEDVNQIIAKLTVGFSFAYLKELFVAVLLTIARGGTGDEFTEGTDENSLEETPSEDGHVVVEHADAKEEKEASSSSSKTDAPESDNGKASTEKETETVKPSPPKVKRIVPEVEIPEHLKDNILLKVTKIQVKTLLEEMDNSEEASETSEKSTADNKGDAKQPLRVRRTIRSKRFC